MRIALTREVSPAVGRCELVHREREAIDLGTARAQHRAYEESLAGLGCRIQRLPASADLPDSVFVEDTAVVLPELAVITRPGAPSRRAEIAAVAAALAEYRPLVRLRAPARLDGGDVLQVERDVFVGCSSRTDPEGIRQLARAVEPAGYRVHEVPVRGCLHLKSAATRVGERTLLVQPDWIDVRAFAALRRIEVDPAEPHAANALAVGGSLLFSAAFPRTRRRLQADGLHVVEVDVAELAKAEGGLTCCSLVFETPDR